MPIIAKNLIIGENKKQEPLGTSVPDVKTFSDVVQRSEKPEEKNIMTKSVVQTPVVKSSKYIQKEDGELIRHINRKSDYLKDVFDLDS